MSAKLTAQEKKRTAERSRRLKAELKRFGSLRELHRAVEQRLGSDTRGTSYGAIRGIVEGKIGHPRPNVMEAISEALGVRYEYLMDLEGARSVDAERVRTETTAAMDESLRDDGDSADRLQLGSFVYETVPQLDELSPAVGGALIMLILRYVEARERVGVSVSGPDELREIVGYFWDFVTEPIAHWRQVLEREVPLDPEEFGDFAMAMIHALNLSIRAAIPPGVTPDLVERWGTFEEEDES